MAVDSLSAAPYLNIIKIKQDVMLMFQSLGRLGVVIANKKADVDIDAKKLSEQGLQFASSLQRKLQKISFLRFIE